MIRIARVFSLPYIIYIIVSRKVMLPRAFTSKQKHEIR
uniref:Uncharacterized protein n=1 Tax=Anguilla anguilla TaxID=7936 RepID=A0A0E9XHZ4_ANGAN